jgi:hypothetical protein
MAGYMQKEIGKKREYLGWKASRSGNFARYSYV